MAGFGGGTPTAVTVGSTHIASTGATLNGLITPNGPVTIAYFQYGLDTNYGSFSATNFSGGLGVALQFNGSNGYVSVPNFGQIAPTPEITLEFWQFVGAATNQSAFVQATTNLLDWVAVGPATETAPGSFQFTDPQAVNNPHRFYRLLGP